MKKSTLKFDLELDENNVPKKIIMNSSDNQDDNILLKSVIIAAWDEKTKETLRVDLWTKDMMVNEMFIMYHQTLMSMANTLSKSTSQDKLAGALRDYCAFFAQETKIIQSKKD
jgi:gliding motility-associated protein GldC